MTTLAVNEIFGPTFQGEGPNAGYPCVFLRLAACNQACVWCDTKYTWDWKHYDKAQEVHPMELPQIVEQLKAVAPPYEGWDEPLLLVISGGEPMLQQKGLAELLPLLPGWGVEIETAGTIPPLPELANQVLFNVSLKLAHSGNPLARRRRPAAINALRDTNRAIWKFVAQQPSDLDEVDELVNTYGLAPVYIMPEGTTHAVLAKHARALAPAVIERGWTLTPRLQIELWGKKRGV